MTIKIKIPANIVTILRDDYGYKKTECSNLIKEFLKQMLLGWYGGFASDFDLWLKEKDEKELNQIIKGKHS